MMCETAFACIFLLIGYGFGCFSTGYFVGKLNGRDIRSEGSGNIGTTNALRTMGVRGGGLTFAGDLLKAFIPTLAVRLIFCANMGYEADLTYLMTLFTGLGVVIGHNFPFYLNFKGGKGIAVSAAVIIAHGLPAGPYHDRHRPRPVYPCGRRDTVCFSGLADCGVVFSNLYGTGAEGQSLFWDSAGREPALYGVSIY